MMRASCEKSSYRGREGASSKVHKLVADGVVDVILLLLRHVLVLLEYLMRPPLRHDHDHGDRDRTSTSQL